MTVAHMTGDRAPAPDFVVIGAAKSGTTSLRRYLGQHPAVFMADYGEPSFFAHEGEDRFGGGPGDDAWTFVTDWAAYADLFRGAGPHQVRGEISPRYLHFDRAVGRLRRRVPAVKLVAILRHPVDRAYSHWLMNRARGCEPEADFATALTLGAERAARGWGWDWQYVGAGLYHRQLQPYVEAFPPDQLKVLLYDDWQAAGTGLLEELFTFLGVDPTFRPDTGSRERVAALPRSEVLRRLTESQGAVKTALRQVLPADVATRLKSRVTGLNAAAPPVLHDGLRRRLFGDHFARDCAALEHLIDRDLQRWR